MPWAGDRPLTWGDLSWQVAAFGAEEAPVSRVRVLAGTRKGAFVLTSDGKREDCRLRVYRSRTGGDGWEPLPADSPRQHCYVNVLRDAMAIDTPSMTAGLLRDHRRAGVRLRRHLGAHRPRPARCPVR